MPQFMMRYEHKSEIKETKVTTVFKLQTHNRFATLYWPGNDNVQSQPKPPLFQMCQVATCVNMETRQMVINQVLNFLL